MGLFTNHSEKEFESIALVTFRSQYEGVEIYRKFINSLGKTPEDIKSINDIPFLPAEFFKNHKIISENKDAEIIFSSSGTTGSSTSKHYVADLTLYKESFKDSFELFYGSPSDYCILALLPSYLERDGSSLIYMTEELIRLSGHKDSGFYLNNFEDLSEKLKSLKKQNIKILLLGVSFALLDLAGKFPQNLSGITIMETGGMKGRKKEITREELHKILQNAFHVDSIHSEYGMTELLSQAYSKGKGIYYPPPWMKILITDPHDPFEILPNGKSGRINIIDLANQNSCSFISTSDLGKVFEDGSFEVLGRMDYSDLRGCNLMVE